MPFAVDQYSELARMCHYPNFETFQRLADDYELVPVYRTLLSDTLTPVSAFDRLQCQGTSCLFESVIGGEKVGRYSFLGTNPFMQIHATGRSVTVLADGETTNFKSDDPLQVLRERLAGMRVARLDGLPPFIGGAVGYAGYDVVRYTENLPHAPPNDRGLPDLSFAFYDHIIVFDHITKTVTVVVLAKTENKTSDVRESYEQACRQLKDLVGQLSNQSTSMTPADIDVAGNVNIAYQSNFCQQDFEDAVRRCVDYIQAGDVFQVVISQRLEVPILSDAFEVYRTLRVVNPSPFMFFLRSPEVTLVGSSPEIMCRVVDGTMTVRPLAGTRPRGRDESHDRQLAEELLNDPKERAEHVMLVDLGRNDVGRVARYGTVELTDVMTIERYSHVMHISSNVNGQLQEGFDAFDALKASLPAGTVSGAPKVRAMEIIDEMEPHRRGPYAGAVGYIDYRGNMDTCIALRTIVIHNGKAYVQAGAGIVADSVPENEFNETLNKARGLLKAIELTEQRCRN